MAATRAKAVLLAILASGTLAGCQSAAMLSDPSASRGLQAESAFDRMGRIFAGPDTSVENQKALGDRLAGQALGRVKLAEDPALEQYLGVLANRLAADTKAQELKFKIYLVDDKAPNAFTPGGGHIFVTTGLVTRLKSESQMAMVLAHEVAHNAKAHVVKGAHRRAVGQRATAASKTVFDSRLGLTWVGEKIGLAINATVTLYTGDQEDAADEAGLDYMIAAGYDPREAIATFEALMGERGGASPLQPLGDGSAKNRRIRRLNNLMKAKYKDRDFSAAVRSSPAYDRLAGRYWPKPVAAQGQ